MQPNLHSPERRLIELSMAHADLDDSSGSPIEEGIGDSLECEVVRRVAPGNIVQRTVLGCEFVTERVGIHPERLPIHRGAYEST